jgi:hypothetical protein
MSDVPFDPDADLAKRRHEVYVASRVEALLHDPEIDKILNGLLHGFQNAWLTELNKDARELLWLKAMGLQEFINTLQSVIDTGKMAATQLASIKNDDEETSGE